MIQNKFKYSCHHQLISLSFYLLTPDVARLTAPEIENVAVLLDKPNLLEPAPQGMVGAEGASSGQQRGRDLLGPLNTTSILTSESQLALSDRVRNKLPAPGSTIHRWSTLTRLFSISWLLFPLRKIIFPIFISGGTHAQICSEQHRERRSVGLYIYIYYLIGHAKLILWYLRHFFEERLRRDNHSKTLARSARTFVVFRGDLGASARKF